MDVEDIYDQMMSATASSTAHGGRAADRIENEVNVTLREMFENPEENSRTAERIEMKKKLAHAKNELEKFTRSIRGSTGGKRRPFRVVEGKIIPLTDKAIDDEKKKHQRIIAECELRLSELKIEAEGAEDRLGGEGRGAEVQEEEKEQRGKRKTRVTAKTLMRRAAAK